MNSSVQYRIAELLKGSGQSLSVAESCTGGRISHLITTVSGSSEYYIGGVCSYAVKVKEQLLGVPSQVIEQYGVVSREVAAAMAEGVRALTQSTWSVATTGLAEGSDLHYPEGTVWIAVSGPIGTYTLLYQCDFARKGNIKSFTLRALEFLEEKLLKYQNDI